MTRWRVTVRGIAKPIEHEADYVDYSSPWWAALMTSASAVQRGDGHFAFQKPAQLVALYSGESLLSLERIID